MGRRWNPRLSQIEDGQELPEDFLNILSLLFLGSLPCLRLRLHVSILAMCLRITMGIILGCEVGLPGPDSWGRPHPVTFPTTLLFCFFAITRWLVGLGRHRGWGSRWRWNCRGGGGVQRDVRTGKHYCHQCCCG
jgi:hypothetical protein